MDITLNNQGESIWLQEKEQLDFGGKSHNVCNGYIDLVQISNTHQAFCCRSCNLRFVFPVTVNTKVKLKKFVKAHKEQG